MTYDCLPHQVRSAESAAELREQRAKRAAELFWEGREALLLSDDELHGVLWDALCQYVSPPWPAEGLGDSDSDPHGEVGRKLPKPKPKPKKKKKKGEEDDEGQGEEEGEEEEDENDKPEEEEVVGTRDRHARIHYEDYLLVC